jgi:hypothetical protein
LPIYFHKTIVINANNVTIQNTTINSGAVVKVNACNDITISNGVAVKSGGVH